MNQTLMQSMQTKKQKFAKLSKLKHVISSVFILTIALVLVITSVFMNKAEVKAAISVPNNKAMFNKITNFSQMETGQYLYCLIVHDTTKRYLTGQNDGDGAAVICQAPSMNDYGGSQMQKKIWKMIKNDDGTFYFKNARYTDKYLNLAGNNGTNETLVTTHTASDNASKWRLTLRIPQYGVYSFQPKDYNTYLNLATEDSTKVQVYNEDHTANSGFIILPLVQCVDSGALGYMATGIQSKISHVATGYNITAPEKGNNASYTNDFGNNSIQPPTTDATITDKQKFTLEGYTADTQYCLWTMRSSATMSGANYGYIAPKGYSNGGRFYMYYAGANVVNKYRGFYITYNMGAPDDSGNRTYGYNLITVTATSEGNPTAGYAAGTKGSLRALEIAGGNTNAQASYIQLWDYGMYNTNQLWYFQDKVQVTVTDKTTDNNVNSTVLDDKFYFNTKISSSSYAQEHIGYSLTSSQDDVLLDGEKSLTNTFSPNVYTITLDNTEGDGGTEVLYYKYKTGYYSDPDCTNEIEQITAPTRTGYSFGGYRTGVDGTGERHIDSGLWLSDRGYTENTTLYAEWNSIVYWVNFSENGGTGSALPIHGTMQRYDVAFEAPANTFTKSGYKFIGWNTMQDGSGTMYQEGDAIKNLTTESKTVWLYAQWEAVPFDVTINYYLENIEDDNYTIDGSKTEIKSFIVNDVFKPTDIAPPEGFQFIYFKINERQYTGDYTFKAPATQIDVFLQRKRFICAVPTEASRTPDGNGGNAVTYKYGTEITVTLKEGGIDERYQEWFGFFNQKTGEFITKDNSFTFVMPAERVDIESKKQTKTYTITFDTDGGSTNVLEQTYTARSSFKLPGYAVTKPGYSFAGWVVSSAEGYYWVLGTKYNRVDYEIPSSNNGVYSYGNVTLKATWTGKPYTVWYQPNVEYGGEGITQTVSYKRDEAFQLLTDHGFYKRGYEFAGWNTMEDGSGTFYADGATVINLVDANTENIELYAQWKVVSYKVIYVENGGVEIPDGEYTYDSSFTLATSITRAGYNFAGWFDNSELTGAAVVSINQNQTGDKTFYAKWIARDDTVYQVYHYQMDVNGNYPETPFETQRFTGTTDTSVTPSVKSYAWFTSPATQTATIAGDGSMIVEYRYVRDKYYFDVNRYLDGNNQSNDLSLGTFTLYVNGDLRLTDANNIWEQFYYGSEMKIVVNAPIAGYSYIGAWLSNENDNGTSSPTPRFDPSITEFTVTINENYIYSYVQNNEGQLRVELTLKYTTNQYNLSYELNGGSVNGTNPITYNVNTESITLISPTKTGYTFIGWTGTDLAEATMTVIIPVGSIGDREYTATYRANTYTIVYKENGGIGKTENSIHEYDAPKALSANGFSREYTITLDANGGILDKYTIPFTYVLEGWNDENGKFYAPGAMVENLTAEDGATITLTAKWTWNSVTLPVPTRDNGMEFLFWSQVEVTAGGVLVPINNNFVAYVDKNTTFYAYYVKLDDAGVKNKPIKPDGSVTLSITAGIYGEGETPVNLVTRYRWEKIGKDANGENFSTIVSTDSTYTPTVADKNCAIKGVAYFDISGVMYSREAISALYIGDQLVDATTTDDPDGKKKYYYDYNYDSVGVSPDISGTYFYSFIYDNVEDKYKGLPVSQVIIEGESSYTFELYGFWGTNKVLIGSTALLEQNVGVSKENAVFDRYELVVKGEKEPTKVNLRYIPRVYELSQNGNTFGAEYYYQTGVDSFVKGQRTTAGGKIYFYEGDIIKIHIPVSSDKKISAGSYVLIDGVKVYPTASTSANGIVEIRFKNTMDHLLGREKEAKKILFSNNELIINLKNITFAENGENTNRALNFAPLGVKLKTEYEINGSKFMPVRFGTVWYFDDYAATKCWSRGDGMGTLIIRPRKMFSDKNNDFYNYVRSLENNADAKAIIGLFGNATVDANTINSKKDSIINLLNSFSKYWAQKGEESINDFNRLPSFGTNVAANTPAEYYYYVKNENGKYVMEYSAVLDVPYSMYNEPLLAISYASYVKGSEGYFVPVSQAPYNVYLLGEVERFVTVAELQGN